MRYSSTQPYKDTMDLLEHPDDYLNNKVPQAERGTFWVDPNDFNTNIEHNTIKTSADLSKLDVASGSQGGMCCAVLCAPSKDQEKWKRRDSKKMDKDKQCTIF